LMALFNGLRRRLATDDRKNAGREGYYEGGEGVV